MRMMIDWWTADLVSGNYSSMSFPAFVSKNQRLTWFQAIYSSMSFPAFVAKNKWKLLIATQGVVTIALMYKRKLDLEASKRGMKDSNTQQANISTGR